MKTCPHYSEEQCNNRDYHDEPMECPEEYEDDCMWAKLADDHDDNWFEDPDMGAQ